MPRNKESQMNNLKPLIADVLARAALAESQP